MRQTTGMLFVLTLVAYCVSSGCAKPLPGHTAKGAAPSGKAAESNGTDDAITQLMNDFCEFQKSGGNNDDLIRYIRNKASVEFLIRSEVTDQELKEAGTTLEQMLKEFVPHYGVQYENTNLSWEPVPDLRCEAGKPVEISCTTVFAELSGTLDHVVPYDAAPEDIAKADADFVAMKTKEFEAFAAQYGPSECVSVPITLKRTGFRDLQQVVYAGLFKGEWRIVHTPQGMNSADIMENEVSECGWLINYMAEGYRHAAEAGLDLSSPAGQDAACKYASRELYFSDEDCMSEMEKMIRENCRPESYALKRIGVASFEVTAQAPNGCCYCATEKGISPDPDQPGLCTPDKQCECPH
jgi:hypothetical protein